MEQKSKLKIIRETAQFYNSGNRSVANGSCLYIGPDGKNCAFGRCCDLDDPKKFQFLRKYNAAGAYSILDSEFGQEILKPDYQGHSVDFWQDIQALHDAGACWTETGISQYGENNVKLLIEKWS